MKVFTQNRLHPSQVLFAFDDALNHEFHSVKWAVAYSTRSGCERLVNRILSRVDKSRWEEAEKCFITSLDFGLTDPTALEFLASIPGSEVRIANPQVITNKGFAPARAYHPKMYLFGGETEDCFVVGSANLTNSALISNTEMVIAGVEQAGAPQWGRAWNDLLLDSELLTDPLLATYKANRKQKRWRPVEPDGEIVAPPIKPKGKRAFFEAVADGTVRPTQFNHFWIEAGSMSSGGSHNQLEMPRAANRFFGFTHDDYGDEHITIGNPILTLRTKSWDNRPLTWHGNNKMERLNLPTKAQGGLEYRQTAVLFRRHERGFEINAAPWEDETAVAWRAASDSLDTVFRLGKVGRRLCGLF